MNQTKGYTLIEIIVTVAIIAILAAVALPAYDGYVRRARISDAFNNLLSLKALMQLYSVENRNYGTSKCGVPMTNSKYFTYVCKLGEDDDDDDSNNLQGYRITATGTGNLANYTFSIDNNGIRNTNSFPGVSGLPIHCWIDRPKAC